MPGWLQVFVVAALSAVVALQLAILFDLRSRPNPADEAVHADILTLLRELSAVFREWPDAFGVLDEIVAQFRTNTGHSMRDLLDRLEKAATVAATAAEVSATAAEANVAAVSHLSTVVTMGAATGLRIEEEQHGVAADLGARDARADATAGQAGEAADAASRSPVGPENVSNTDSSGENHERP
jgi:hypothetical protein